VKLGIGFLHVLIEAGKARLLVSSALEHSKYFITRDHVKAMGVRRQPSSKSTQLGNIAASD
jgi:hypothetical protein